MTRYFRAARLALAASSFLTAVLPAQIARRLAQLPESGARVALPQSVSGISPNAERLGPLSADTVMTSLSLVLKPTEAQDAALTQLLADQQNPSSPNYHQWLTPQQFGERFGLAEADLAVLQTWLQSQGVQVDEIAASRNSIRFHGTAAQVEAAFSTTLDQYRDGTQTFHANSMPVQLPSAIAAVTGGVSGLSSYRLQAQNVRMTAEQIAAANATAGSGLASPQYTTATNAHYLVPGDFRKIFGISTLGSSGFNGAGVTIGVIGQSAVDLQQITYFQQKTAQTVKLPTLVLVPGSGVSNRVSGDQIESELDLEYASGTAPGATVQFIYTGCGTTASSTILPGTTDCGNDGVFAALQYAIAMPAPRPSILTLSYGGCETSNANYANNILEPALRQGNAQGQTILVSSGDSAAATCDYKGTAFASATQGLTVSYPASSPYVTAVGGTQLNSDSSLDWSSGNSGDLSSAVRYMQEVAWNDSVAGRSVVGSGGGVSKIFAKPTWQGGTGVPADGKRDVPDVSFPASAAFHPYMICAGDAVCTSGTGGFTPGRDGTGIGGTSAAAPNFAAMLAVIQQANGGASLGNINPRLYTLASGASASSIFHDITTGNNQAACTIGTPDCTTSPIGYTTNVGYDLVTGLGSVDAVALRTVLSTVTVRTPILTLSTATTPVIVSTAIRLSLNVAGDGASAPTGTVQFAVDNTNVGPLVTVSSGVAAYSYTGFAATGNHIVTATFVSGDTNYTSANVTIAVTVAQATPVLALSLSSTTPLQNKPLTFTATVSGVSRTPTGTVNFLLDGVTISPAVGVALSGGTASFTYSGIATVGTHRVSFGYGGDTIYNSRSSSETLITVTSPTATLTPTVSLTGPATGTVSTFLQYRVAVTGTGSTPTGTVIYTLDNVPSSTLSLFSGVTFIQLAIGTSGTHTLTATYGGDATYLSSTSASVTITIPPPSFTMAFAPTTLTVNAGSDGTGTLTGTSVNGFSGSVGLRYVVTAVSGGPFAGCLYTTGSSSTLNISPGSSSTLPLAVHTAATSPCTTTGIVQAIPSAVNHGEDGGLPLTAIGAAGLLGCCLIRRRMIVALCAAVVVVAMSLGLSGCGGSSSAATTTSTTTTTAAKGTYTVTLSGTAGTTAPITAGTTFTLIVQ